MIEVHHLNNSRSQRILWLLEELNAPYTLIKHLRDPQTNLAPDALKEIHPLGKSPVIVDNGEVIMESAAICTYIIDKYAPKDFSPNPDDKDYYQYHELMHYAEGSAMLPFLLFLYSSVLGAAAAPLVDRIFSEMQNHIGYLSTRLGSNDFFFRNTFSGTDIMLSFVLEAADVSDQLKDFPNLKNTLAIYQSRSDYQVALEKGGEYKLGG
ncbi:MAG: glutathione S-transferase [SAR86 cluster bacterium]|jgi:glutathione S-transferase|nr:glutathione S-transferase [SAR86 cluster bacterium]|tara:strand:- start:673 stop:1299 length:627 start_codon:yes stop_codon:yes gene_type:complete